jgi:hypothetical protein
MAKIVVILFVAAGNQHSAVRSALSGPQERRRRHWDSIQTLKFPNQSLDHILPNRLGKVGETPKLPALNVTFYLVVKAFFEHPPRSKRCLRATTCPNLYTYCFISHHRLVYF